MVHAGVDQEALLQHDNDKHQQLRWMQRNIRERRWANSGMFALGFLSMAAVVIFSFMTAVGVMQHAMTPPRSASVARRAGEEVLGAAASWLKERVDAIESKPKSNKPNVFFLYIDDLGWNDIGYQSSDLRAMTPNLNRMAEGGVTLTQYYSMSVCTPARAALMTGRYPIRYGFQYGLIHTGAPWGLPLEEKLLPEYMKDAGYTSHMVGKWHLGGHTFDHMPHRRGFETHLGYTYGRETYWTHEVKWNKSEIFREGEKAPGLLDFGFGNETAYYDVIERAARPSHPPAAAVADSAYGATRPASTRQSRVSPLSLFSSSPRSVASSSSISENKYSTEIFTDRALEILEGKTPFDEEPLFLYLAHQAVHEPLELPPDDAFSLDEMALLDALKEGSPDWDVRVQFAKILMFLDKTIGRLMDHLDDEGWLQNSIIVVASDNGGCPLFGGSNRPLRGVKGTYWEGGTKVPALVYSPSHIPEERWGKEYEGLMHVTDWLPTLAAAADFEPSGSHGELDGVNHWDQITKGSPHSIEPGDDNGSGVMMMSRESAYTPRKEMLYNFDPYYFVANRDGTISKPDFSQAQGAFRRGKWKLLFKVCSLDADADDGDQPFPTQQAVNQNERREMQDVGATSSYCFVCAETCVDKSACTDWLFNLEEDPREEHNLASAFPDVVQELQDRVSSVVNQEMADSLYVAADPNARSAWKTNNHWVVPWLHRGKGNPRRKRAVLRDGSPSFLKHRR